MENNGYYIDVLEKAADLFEEHAPIHEAIDIAKEIQDDFVKCFDAVQLLASVYPDVPGVWTGSTSERLTILVSHIMGRD
jgi:hypothetical protein